MRIVVVSAHYPPNFVSGGTLAAERLARGLAARGHDVAVFAGWFGKDRLAGETWEGDDATGLPVRWVVTTPWTLWDDDHNWDNPIVAEQFRAFLDEARPDVVHLHSLQSLGAGLVAEARRAGARVVVTMHDFWWVCARQFLVDRDVQPCSLVVDAGLCPCECDRQWLLDRNQALRDTLRDVDLVLAPSAVAARVLAANGVDPQRLEVDENSLPARLAEPGPAAAPQPPDGDLRLLYTGGPNPLKGVHVLLDAVARVAARPGWRLAAHDIEPYLRTSHRSVEGLPVDVVPPFDPGSADEVYAGADVVVIPSVMRETFSLVAREALTRGVPVVCTDTLGPEEVVVHEANGLVVPAADPAALAAAFARLLDEPGLLDRLREGCGAVSVRTLDDQVDGLEARFAGLVKAPTTLPEAAVDIGRVLFVCGIDGAPLRYRARLPAEALGLLGVATDVVHYRDPEAPALAARADAVVFYRVPATPQVLRLVDEVRARGTATFFDVDDLIFDPDVAGEIPALELLPPDEAALWLEGVRRYRTTMDACDVYIGSTGPLVRHAADVTGMPARRFDNGVGLGVAQLSDRARSRPRRAGPLRMAYLSGTRTHDLDWRSIEPAVVEILARHSEVELWLLGHVNVSPALERFGARVRRHAFRPWTELPDVLRDVDVNLAPLVLGSRFNEAKSAVKWLEAALTETPTIATPTEPMREVVRPGENGVLAAGPEEWADALDALLGDAALRRRLGRRARRDALLSLSPHLQARRYLAILVSEEGRKTGRFADQNGGTVRDEPPMRVALEPYAVTFPDAAGARRAPLPRVRRLAGQTWSSLRSEGAAATARRAAGYSRRQYEARVRPMLESGAKRARH